MRNPFLLWGGWISEMARNTNARREFIVKWKDLRELRVWGDMAFGGGG
jgi:hypothetical protein